MIHLKDLSVEEQLEILTKAQIIAIEEDDFEECDKIEKMINELIPT